MSASSTDEPKPKRVYGRRRGRRLRPGRQRLMETLLPRLRVPLEGDGDFRPEGLFPGPPEAVWLEIGFGAGEHLAAQAESHPEVGFLGCEPFLDGVANLLALIDGAGLGNIRLLDDDARLLLAALPDACLDRVFLLFNDPWPKTRTSSGGSPEPGESRHPGAGDAGRRGVAVRQRPSGLCHLEPGAADAPPRFRLDGEMSGRLADAAGRRLHHPLRGQGQGGRADQHVPAVPAPAAKLKRSQIALEFSRRKTIFRQRLRDESLVKL